MKNSLSYVFVFQWLARSASYGKISQFSMEEREQKLIYAWVFGSKSLNILIFGKIGTGKSSLINTLLKEQVAEEGEGIYSKTKEVESYTRTIRPIETIINDVRVTLWDTPGLRDPFTDGKKTMGAISEVCCNVDLFIFCTRLDQARLSQDDVDAIRDLTAALGESIWKRAIFALTFANKTRPSSGHPDPDYLPSRVTEWQSGLHDLVRTQVENIVSSTIPVIPTGYKEEPLPGGRKWFTPFWEACLARVRYNSLPALLRVNKDGWLDPETRHRIASRVIAHRLKEIGDVVEDDIDPELIPKKVDPVQMLDVVADAIQSDEENIISQTFRRVGLAWESYGTPALVVAGVAVVAAKLIKSTLY